MKYKTQSLAKYLDDLSARLPAPGGGSAAALNAAMAASLISMVVNFTLGKLKYAVFEAELKDVLVESEQLKNDFLDLVDLDVEAYQSRDIRKAMDVPFMLSRLCARAAKLCPPLLKKGNVALLSDVAAAAVLLESAFVCARFNVEVNLQSLGDKKLAQGVKKELNQMDKIIKRIRKNTEDGFGKITRR
ncbi:MAG: cyclodeaminase/cyclohydrolase family protein [Candidatus Omnitrophica bacterium]|jgi:formiminotetrahydrofolate cyclodeaminase|nr:cyclodeaminase/cyclohydrolase family protein [Candidatus Omnitrophota bacterium]MDD5660696.1 cyclodeaminase/cyclohydrolase family protein [Candidatus Omnitrophota bacterium]